MNAIPRPGQSCAVVVDDDEDAADSIALALELLGMVVLVAYSAREALALVQKHRPAVVVTDLDMPHMDGIDEAMLLRAMPEGRDVCLIALTGSHAMEARARAVGFDHFFLKPGDFDKLGALVHDSCSRAGRLSP